MENIDRFTWGDCHILALEIHRVTGYKLAIAGERPGRHAFCIDENGNALDIHGRRPLTEIKAEWGDISETTAGYIKGAWKPPGEAYEGSKKIAEKIVPELVNG